MSEEKWSMPLTCSPRVSSRQLLLLMGIWHMLLLHLLLCCCSGTTSSAFDQLSTSAKKPRTHARFFVVEWKRIHFLPHEKCAHAQELSSTILLFTISRSSLGDLWYQIWTGIKALLTGAFPLILMASEWGPIKDTGISSNSLWWITKAFPSVCHLCSLVWVKRLVYGKEER